MVHLCVKSEYSLGYGASGIGELEVDHDAVQLVLSRIVPFHARQPAALRP